MQMSFSVDMQGLQNEHNKKTQQAQKVLFLSMSKMSEIAKSKAPVDTGHLRRNIFLDPRSPNASEYYLVAGVNYAAHVEYGTRPHFPPTDQLEGWSRRKLKDSSASFPVAKKIAMRGTPAQPFFRPALLQVKTIHVPRIWQRVMSKA